MIDLRQTRQYSVYVKSIGWEVEKIGRNHVFIKRVPIFGSIIKIQRPQDKISRVAIKEIRRKHRAKILYIEPRPGHAEHYVSIGFKQYNHPFLPSKTIQMDLSRSEQELLDDMHHKTRYNIKVASKRRLIIKSTKDVELFAEFWQKQANKRRSFIPEKNFMIKMFMAYGSKARIYLASVDGTVIAGVMVLCTSDIIYYMYAASNQRGRDMYAPTLLIWEVIKFGKQAGYKIFDFEGIYDSRFPLPAWEGFSRFKKGFGGRVVKYPGAYKQTSFF